MRYELSNIAKHTSIGCLRKNPEPEKREQFVLAEFITGRVRGRVARNRE